MLKMLSLTMINTLRGQQQQKLLKTGHLHIVGSLGFQGGELQAFKAANCTRPSSLKAH